VRRCDHGGVGCGMVGGIGFCHPVGHWHGGRGRRRAEAAGEGLRVPLPKPRRRGRRLLWRRQRERGSHLLHRKVILGCRRKGVRCRPVRGSAHGRIKRRCLGGLHRKAILGCCEEGVRRRPVQGSTHGNVVGRPGACARVVPAGTPTTAAVAQGPAASAGAPVTVAVA
jgi:hypothetical protein